MSDIGTRICNNMKDKVGRLTLYINELSELVNQFEEAKVDNSETKVIEQRMLDILLLKKFEDDIRFLEDDRKNLYDTYFWEKAFSRRLAAACGSGYGNPREIWGDRK